ncbi:MAG TPA: DinB family protein [Thermoanaerobaculia bacterium]|nr:DinB family protein [Thermoanaerobaculia bacterium]
MSQDRALRDHLLYLLRGGGAHAPFDQVIADLPAELRGVRPPGASHSPWEVLEHLRLAQWDILEFSRNGDHVSPDWPEGYWPQEQAPPDAEAWDRSIETFRRELQELEALVDDPASDLYAAFPWGKDQTLLREALLVADHNAYHLGELVLLRRLLGAWPA